MLKILAPRFTVLKLSMLAGLASFMLSQPVAAQLVQNITLGNPKALGLANAVTADPPDIDSIHFNPAGLARIQGRQRQFKLLAAHIMYETKIGARHLNPNTESAYENVSGGKPYPTDSLENTTSKTSDPMLILPGFGMQSLPMIAAPFAGIAIEDPSYGWTFATAIYSPSAIGYNRGANDPGAFQGQELSITRITYFSPSVAFRYNDKLMLGASLGFSWQGLGLKTKFRAPEVTVAFLQNFTIGLNQAGIDLLRSINPYDTIGTLEIEVEDPLSLSFNLGLLWEPTEWASFGVVYQSESLSNLEGDFKMTYTDNWLDMTLGFKQLNSVLKVINNNVPFNAERVEKGRVKLDYTHPQHLAFGSSIKVLPDLKVNIDLKWIDYAAWDYLDFKFSKPADYLSVSNLIYKFGPSKGDGDNADPDLMRIKRAYRSVWSWAIGVEYQYDDNIVLRAGYEPRKSVVPPNRVDLLAPIADADLYTVGAGYQIDAYSRVEAAFGYMTSKFNSPAGGSENMNSTKPGRVVYNPYAFLDINQKTSAFLVAFSYDEKF